MTGPSTGNDSPRQDFATPNRSEHESRIREALDKALATNRYALIFARIEDGQIQMMEASHDWPASDYAEVLRLARDEWSKVARRAAVAIQGQAVGVQEPQT